MSTANHSALRSVGVYTDVVYICAPQASTAKQLAVTIPSGHLQQQSTFSFVLRVDTVLGGSSHATVEVYKSSVGLLVSKVCTG